MIITARACTLALAPLALMLAGCGSDAAPETESAESFAARIKSGEATPGVGSAPAPAATATPQIAQPKPGAAPGAFARGTLTDPAARTCGAPLVASFIGRPADQATRAEIAKSLGRTDNLRFVAFGATANVNPDPTNPRLSIMLDAQNVIRDARCG